MPPLQFAFSLRIIFSTCSRGEWICRLCSQTACLFGVLTGMAACLDCGREGCETWSAATRNNSIGCCCLVTLSSQVGLKTFCSA
uniref:Uncharacterized protein n=1 Tax=Ixodes ricinus TaxID=34613 RepID=A0A6B0U8G7_IXORI